MTTFIYRTSKGLDILTLEMPSEVTTYDEYVGAFKYEFKRLTGSKLKPKLIAIVKSVTDIILADKVVSS